MATLYLEPSWPTDEMSPFSLSTPNAMTSACLWTIPQASRPVPLKQGNSYKQSSFSTNQITLTRSSHLKKGGCQDCWNLTLNTVVCLQSHAVVSRGLPNLLSGIISGLRELPFSTQQLVGTHINDMIYHIE